MLNNQLGYLKNLFTYFISGLIRGISVLVGFLLTIVVTKNFNMSDASAFFLILSLITIASYVLTYGREYLILSEVAVSHKNKSLNENILYVMNRILPIILISLFACILLSIFILNLNFFNYSSLAINIKKVVYSIPALTGIILLSYGIQGQDKISLSIFTSRILCPLSIIAIFNFGFAGSISNILQSYVVIAWLTLLITLIFFIRGKGSINNKEDSNVYNKGKDTKNIYLFAIGVCQQIFIWQGTILTFIFFQNEDISLIVVSQRTALIISFILITINAVNAPKFARFYAIADFDAIKRLAVNSALLAIFFGALVSFFMFIYAENILYFFGQEYSYDTDKLKILILGQIFSCIAGPVGIILLMTHNYKYAAISSIIALLISFIFVFIFKDLIGLNVVPISIVLSLFLKNSIDMFYTNNLLRA